MASSSASSVPEMDATSLAAATDTFESIGFSDGGGGGALSGQAAASTGAGGEISYQHQSPSSAATATATAEATASSSPDSGVNGVASRVSPNPLRVSPSDPLRDLFEACKSGHLERVRDLVTSANVNARDTAGRRSSPLHFAAGKEAAQLHFSHCLRLFGLSLCK